MKSTFGKVFMGSVLIGCILVTGNSVFAQGMTGSTSKATKKQNSKKWKNQAPKLTDKQREKIIEKTIDIGAKFVPAGEVLKQSIKVGVWANKKKLKNTGVGALTSGTTNNCKKKKK